MHIIFFGSCANLYVIIELIVQIKLDAEEGGFRWKFGVGGGGGGANLIQAIYSMFLHEHLWEPQSDLQLHLTISNKDARASGGRSSYRQSLPSSSFQPQSCGGSATPLHCCIPGGKP